MGIQTCEIGDDVLHLTDRDRPGLAFIIRGISSRWSCGEAPWFRLSFLRGRTDYTIGFRLMSSVSARDSRRSQAP